MSILIKNVLLDNKKTDVYIEGNIIKAIGEKHKAEHVIDGSGKAIIPGFINTHTHAATSLLRGFADDMELHDWLQNKMWPVEKKLKKEDVYLGVKLACLEMIKSGTTCFNDMYFFMEEGAKAVEELGVRAVLSAVFFDVFNPEKSDKDFEDVKRTVEKYRNHKLVVPALGPHALYTVSAEKLKQIKEYADKNDLLIHFHLSETEKEVKDCVKKHGKRPVHYLKELDFLGPNLLAAHSIWLDDDEIKILTENKVKISYNPVSNMKLSSGIMPYPEMKKELVSLGTDGCASNNNLDMFESMKFACLLQKVKYGEKTLPAKDVFDMATVNGANALRINAGKVEKGKLADVLLIDLKKISFCPGHNLISDIVYSANSSCVDTTVCNGKILMQNHKVKGEEETIEKARKQAFDLMSR